MNQQQRDQYQAQINELQALLNEQNQRLEQIKQARTAITQSAAAERTKIENAHRINMEKMQADHNRQIAELQAAISQKKQQLEAQRAKDAQEERELQASIAKQKADFERDMTSEKGRKAQMEMNYDEIIEAQDFCKFQVDPEGLENHIREMQAKNKLTVAYRRAKEALGRLLGTAANDAGVVKRLDAGLRRTAPEVRKSWANMIADMDSKILNYQPVLSKGVTVLQIVEGLLTALKRDRKYTKPSSKHAMKCQDYILVNINAQGSLVYKLEARLTADKDLKDQELDTVSEIVFC